MEIVINGILKKVAKETRLRCRGASHRWYLPSTNTLSEDGERKSTSEWILGSEKQNKDKSFV